MSIRSYHNFLINPEWYKNVEKKDKIMLALLFISAMQHTLDVQQSILHLWELEFETSRKVTCVYFVFKIYPKTELNFFKNLVSVKSVLFLISVKRKLKYKWRIPPSLTKNKIIYCLCAGIVMDNVSECEISKSGSNFSRYNYLHANSLEKSMNHLFYPISFYDSGS